MEDKTALTDEQIDAELATLDGWRRDGIFMKKDFIFANFKEINAFLPHLTATIVAQNHHPDFSFISGEKKVSVEVTTHSAADFVGLAAERGVKLAALDPTRVRAVTHLDVSAADMGEAARRLSEI